MKNKITIISAYYYPEDTAIGLYSTQMANFLREKGYEINIITGFPHYPQWKIYKSYSKKKWFLKEKIEGINIFRYKPYIPNNPSFIKRLMLMTDFTIGALINIFKIKNVDFIICIVPFTSTIVIAKTLSLFRRAPIWVHIQDFEFDAALETGLLQKNNKSVLHRVLLSLEKSLLKATHIQSSISKAMIKKLKLKTGKTPFFLPNWIDEHLISPSKSKPHKYVDSEYFNLLYSGNIGAKQNWKMFKNLVDKLKPHKGIRFIVVGAGALKKQVFDTFKSYKNVSLFDPVAYENLSDLLCSADLHILFQKNEVIDTVMPSKLLGMMASEKPSIISGNIKTEVASSINESNGGFYFDSEDSLERIINKIFLLKENEELRKSMGKSGREYVIRHYSKAKVLNRFELKLRETIGEL